MRSQKLKSTEILLTPFSWRTLSETQHRRGLAMPFVKK